MTDKEYLKKTFRLSDKEVDNAAKFITEHKKCKTESRSLANVKYTITFQETPIGSGVAIQCEKCHKEKDISDDVRSNY